MKRPTVCIHWFRRDLRLDDNHGLFKALAEHGNVLPLFIFDTTILDKLENKADRRVDLIHRTLERLHSELSKLGSGMLVELGEPLAIWKMLLDRYEIKAVTANHDHEPYAIQRDTIVRELLAANGIPFRTFKDINIFERDEVVKADGSPYTVYTPYMKKWRSQFTPAMMEAFPSRSLDCNYWSAPSMSIPSLGSIGFSRTDLEPGWPAPSADLLANYERDRNFPDRNGTSGMSVPLRFGLISVRELVRRSNGISSTYLNELIWREFFMQILWHFPDPERAFKRAYDNIPWRDDEDSFQAWCDGRTGYPLVDAGMRELNATGLMHNRVRMVVASFLTKHLLIDWRWGEAYFASKLLDYELSSNNGGWQWASGSGCDASPYFRVFNPQLQLERFDRSLNYVKKWVPEYGSGNYVGPMVVHGIARDRAIKTYKNALAEREGS